MHCRHSADRARGAVDIGVDMVDNASALPTCPHDNNRQKTAPQQWAKINPLDFTKTAFSLSIRRAREIA